jgi:hypothetical protein
MSPRRLRSLALWRHDHPETEGHVERVVRLIEGSETPYGMELLATVHWTVERKGATSLEAAVKIVQDRKPRKGDLFDDSTSMLLGDASKQKAGSRRSLSSVPELRARRVLHNTFFDTGFTRQQKDMRHFCGHAYTSPERDGYTGKRGVNGGR